MGSDWDKDWVCDRGADCGRREYKRIRQIFSMRYSTYSKKPPWCAVARKLKISTQTAINLHNKGVEIIFKKVKSKSLSDFL